MRGHVFENVGLSGLKWDRFQFKCSPVGGCHQLTGGGHHSFGGVLLDIGQSMDILGGDDVIWGAPTVTYAQGSRVVSVFIQI